MVKPNSGCHVRVCFLFTFLKSFTTYAVNLCVLVGDMVDIDDIGQKWSKPDITVETLVISPGASQSLYRPGVSEDEDEDEDDGETAAEIDHEGKVSDEAGCRVEKNHSLGWEMW